MQLQRQLFGVDIVCRSKFCIDINIHVSICTLSITLSTLHVSIDTGIDTVLHDTIHRYDTSCRSCYNINNIHCRYQKIRYNSPIDNAFMASRYPAEVRILYLRSSRYRSTQTYPEPYHDTCTQVLMCRVPNDCAHEFFSGCGPSGKLWLRICLCEKRIL